MTVLEVYRNPAAMEPLMPSTARGELAELTCEILAAAGGLSASIGHQATKDGIAAVVSKMNSYYSNLIEGHRTTPREIEAALEKHYSQDSKKKALQRLGVAHIEVEQLMTERVREGSRKDVFASSFAKWIHKEFYERVPDELRVVKSKSGTEFPMNPGDFRNYPVEVGRHAPPDHATLDEFMDRYSSFYSSDRIVATRRLVAIAAAHHRFLWIHPFGDGNGRVARLMSHAALLAYDFGGYGLWTLSRGLARNRKEYYSILEEADQRRANDYDGRGNLSENSLGKFCVFFLHVVLDQIQFMGGVLECDRLKQRIEGYAYRENVFGKHNDRGKYLLFEALQAGEFARGEAGRLTGYGETVAREILKAALDHGLLESDGPRSPVRLAFPQKVCEDYFPKLYMPSA